MADLTYEQAKKINNAKYRQAWNKAKAHVFKHSSLYEEADKKKIRQRLLNGQLPGYYDYYQKKYKTGLKDVLSKRQIDSMVDNVYNKTYQRTSFGERVNRLAKHFYSSNGASKPKPKPVVNKPVVNKPVVNHKQGVQQAVKTRSYNKGHNDGYNKAIREIAGINMQDAAQREINDVEQIRSLQRSIPIADMSDYYKNVISRPVSQHVSSIPQPQYTPDQYVAAINAPSTYTGNFYQDTPNRINRDNAISNQAFNELVNSGYYDDSNYI